MQKVAAILNKKQDQKDFNKLYKHTKRDFLYNCYIKNTSKMPKYSFFI